MRNRNHDNQKEFGLTSLLEHPAFWRALLVAFFLIVCIYIVSLPLDNHDHKEFLKHWINSLDTDGLAMTLGNQVANYTAPYIIVLSAVNLLLPQASTLTVMHTTGLVLHLFLACVLFHIATLIRPGAGLVPIVLMAALTPTSLMNGIVWGQSDPFFTGFTLLAMLSVIKQRWLLAFVAFSAAISIKLVAVFAVPAFFILLVRAGAIRKIIWLPLILLATYLLMNLPYLVAGLPLAKVLTIYADQATTYGGLAMNAPNFWYILQLHPATMTFAQDWLEPLMILGLVLGAIAALVLCVAGVRGTAKNLTAVDQIWLLAVSAILLPSLLTKMHDRYFFLADATLWLLAIVDRRFIFPAVMAQIGSLATYVTFLDLIPPNVPVPGHYAISLGAVCIIIAAVSLVWVGQRSGSFHRIFSRIESR